MGLVFISLSDRRLALFGTVIAVTANLHLAQNTYSRVALSIIECKTADHANLSQ